MDETRGTLFWNILRVIQARQPSLVLLENVRNLVGPRHRHEWQVIVETLRAEGYRVSEAPAVFSPHLLPPTRGGRPQVRERVFIAATRVPEELGLSLEARPPVTNRPVDGWDPQEWNLEADLPLDDEHVVPGCELSESERLWIDAWDDFVQLMREAQEGRRLPGFPLWADEWRHTEKLSARRLEREPRWKANYLQKNANFYTSYREVIDEWAARWGVYTTAFPPSRRKLEWQAQETARLWDTVMHMRPSGIRAKAPTYLPALVAITQTSIVGPRERRLSPKEAARLQGLPEWFDFGEQPHWATYKQLGNGVSIGAVYHVFREHALRDEEVLKQTAPTLLRALDRAPLDPTVGIEKI
jgi:DNA (cytosine-5)-methyltransferase 1